MSRPRRRRLLPAGLAAVIAALALAHGVAALGAASAEPDPPDTTDPRDTDGPLDITEASLTQRDIRMALRLKTTAGWGSTDLRDAAGREICLVLTQGEPDDERGGGRVCVTRRDGRTALSYTPLAPDGTITGEPRRLAARTSRPSPSTLEATFLPAAAGLTTGPYAWRVTTSWTQDGACAQTCTDLFPDEGEIDGDLALLGLPRCFGAAARDPAKPCENPALRNSVEPPPSRAMVLAEPYCDKRQRTGLIIACGFAAAPEDAVRTFALIGDSHAASLKTPLTVVTLAKRWRGISILRSGCPATRATPILNSPQSSRRCGEWNTQVRQWLARHSEVDTVVLSAHRGARVAPAGGRSGSDATRAGYRAEISALLALGKRVVVIRDAPTSSRAQKRCVSDAIKAKRSAARTCTLPRSFAVRPDELLQAAGDVRSARLRTIDLTHHFCDATRCFAVVGGALVHHDTTHMTRTFAATLGPFVLRALDR